MPTKTRKPQIKLVHSSELVYGNGEETPILFPSESCQIQVSSLKTVTLTGSNSNNPVAVFTQTHETPWFNKLHLTRPPFFLRKYLKNEEQQIFICQHMIHEDYKLKINHKELQEILYLKAWIQRFEKLYPYAYNHGAQGVLFMLPDQEFELFTPFEELFSYIAPHLDMYGERSYWYLPTDQQDYDHFCELSETINREMDQFLWREQKINSWLRSFLQKV